MDTLIAAPTTSPEARIVGTVRRALDVDGVILCGSRATGEAWDASDFDLYVVVPLVAMPRAMAAIGTAEATLAAELGVPVSLHPLPRFRLRRPGRTYLVWKAIVEGQVLEDRRLPRLRPRRPTDVAHARASYAISGVRSLLAHVEPAMLGRSVLSPEVQHDVRKALLHAAQLRLLARGRYASTLDGALASLDDLGEADDLRDVACRTASAPSWISVRRLLLPEALSSKPGRLRAIVDDAQYVALSRLAGARTDVGRVVRSGSVTHRAWMAAISLAQAVQLSGEIDEAYERAAIEWIEPFAGRARDWFEVRGRLDEQWGRIEPLVGL